MLRARMVIIEDVLPLWRGELFMAMVALLISYLYAISESGVSCWR